MIGIHATNCGCPVCRDVRTRAVDVTQADCDLFAAEWAKWVSSIDGEANKLRAGERGAVGSPRWAALQAIARARMGAALGMGAIRA